jgi:hypothetical protein
LAKNNLTREEINKLLLCTNNEGNTVWPTAVRRGTTAVMREIWDLVKKIQQQRK